MFEFLKRLKKNKEVLDHAWRNPKDYDLEEEYLYARDCN